MCLEISYDDWLHTIKANKHRAKKRLEEIEENNNYLHTMSHSSTDRLKTQKKKRKSIVSNSKSNLFQSHRYQLSEVKKSNFKKKIMHRKVYWK